MPTIQVAEIYSNAWLVDDYEAMATIVAESVHSTPTTLLGITCRLYWVRFFYTEINLARWVDVASIQTWQATQRYIIPLASGAGGGSWTTLYTEMRYAIDSPTGALVYTYFPLPCLSLEDTITSIGCLYSIPTTAHNNSYVSISLQNQPSTTPFTAASQIAYIHSHQQSDTYIALSYDCPTPIPLTSASSMVLLALIRQQINVATGAYIALKSLYLETARLI